MERTFATHRIRHSREALPLWSMTTLDAGGLTDPVKVVVPGVWESLPQLKNYRGRAVFEQEVECGGHVRFWFGGVSFRAKVWLDRGTMFGIEGEKFQRINCATPRKILEAALKAICTEFAED